MRTGEAMGDDVMVLEPRMGRGAHQRSTGRNDALVGVNMVLRSILHQHFELAAATLTTRLADHVLVANVQGLLSPAEKGMMRNYNDSGTLYAYLERILKTAEPVLTERLALVLRKEVKQIHYVFGSQNDQIDIIVYFHEREKEQYHEFARTKDHCCLRRRHRSRDYDGNTESP